MDEPFGAPVGKLGDLSGAELKNEFATIPTRSVEEMIQTQRIQPRQVGTGVMRGTQRIVNTDGSYITMGVIPGTTPEEFGFAFFDADDTLIRKITAFTDYAYDPDTGNNFLQLITLSNGERGAAFAKDGEDLVEALDS